MMVVKLPDGTNTHGREINDTSRNGVRQAAEASGRGNRPLVATGRATRNGLCVLVSPDESDPTMEQSNRV
ncbi:MAG TPA: hypothetical protein VFI27_01925 [candidate division Zixibacteria bacterium]|nr:hypothetical protein [candidate division Zixibacteria bacterium]